MNKFLIDLENELKNLKINEKDIMEILRDHEEMIDTARKEGLNDEELEKKFGNPKKLAKDLLEDIEISNEKETITFDENISFVDEKEEDFNLVKSFSDIQDKISIEINLVSDDISLKTYKGESIQIFENKVKQINDYTIEINEGKLLIKKKIEKKIVRFSSKSANFLIFVPGHIKINNYFHKTVSGNIKINGIEVNEFICKTVSGDIKGSNLKLKVSNMSTVSGDIEMASITINESETFLVSGDLVMKNIYTQGLMYFNTVSGDVELNNVQCGQGTFVTVNGDLNGEEFYPAELSINTVNGDLNIKNADSSREIVIIKKKTLSGNIKII